MLNFGLHKKNWWIFGETNDFVNALEFLTKTWSFPKTKLLQTNITSDRTWTLQSCIQSFCRCDSKNRKNVLKSEPRWADRTCLIMELQGTHALSGQSVRCHFLQEDAQPGWNTRFYRSPVQMWWISWWCFFLLTLLWSVTDGARVGLLRCLLSQVWLNRAGVYSVQFLILMWDQKGILTIKRHVENKAQQFDVGARWGFLLSVSAFASEKYNVFMEVGSTLEFRSGTTLISEPRFRVCFCQMCLMCRIHYSGKLLVLEAKTTSFLEIWRFTLSDLFNYTLNQLPCLVLSSLTSCMGTNATFQSADNLGTSCLIYAT